MYQVLARKYRPKNFHELLGQTHVSTALINGIEQQRLHHAYLFTGTRGVGKTTIARILAKCLNCETGITSEPCGVCSTCMAIDAGRFIDLIEIDAASRTRVEDTRELLDNVPYAPTQGRYKVYLIDEVHMLSTHSFNALLKTLEEPPEHVKFLLATTDPQKLPITIISRCLQFVLRPLPQNQLADYLAVILGKEAIGFEPDALWQLASSAKGSVRDALSLTDQAIAFGNGQIGQIIVQQMLGLIDQADVIGLLTAIVQHNTTQVGQAIMQLRQQVVDAKAVFDSLAEILHQLALLQVLPEFDLQLDDRQTQARKQLATLIPADLLQLYYEIVAQSRENMGLANTPLQALEMCILRLMAFRPLAQNEFVPPMLVSANLNSPNTEQDFSDMPAMVTLENGENGTNLTQNFASPTTDNDPQAFSKNSQNPIPNNVANDFSDKVFSEIDFTENQQDTFQQENFAVINDVINDTQSDNDNDNLARSQIAQDLDKTVITIPDITTENSSKNGIDNSEDNDNLENLALSEIASGQHAKSVNLKSINTKNSPIDLATTDLATTTAESPLALLIPPSQDLTGEWSPEKWDYWVFQARANKQIDNDELVLAKRGIMVGRITGHCEFITDVTTKAVNLNFQQLFEKLQQAFVGSEVAFTPYDTAVHGDILQHTPEQLQAKRENLAVAVATQRLSEQPVMQLLLSQNATLSNVTLNNDTLPNVTHKLKPNPSLLAE